MIAAERVAAVLLAAGRSCRFGPEDKLLAAVDGKPLAAHAAETLAAIGFASLIAVCSNDRVAELLGACGFAIVRNDWPEQGQSRSIRLGVEAAGSCDAVLIALADMPFVGADHFRRLLAAHEDVTASAAGGSAQPPALFGRACFGALAALAGDRGAKALLDGAVLVEAGPGALADIDTADAIRIRPAPSA